MMNVNKVYCPWCGDEMKLDRVNEYASYDYDLFCYTCWSCGASSPPYECRDDAYRAAISKPLQDPLTLEEACGSEEPCVFLETFGNKTIYAVDACYGEFIDGVGVSIERIGKSGVIGFPVRDYGKMFRFWANNPTDEERSAAKWEERHEEIM